ncbi:hypothetical protein H8S75_31830 [Hungatella sp. L12]|uniref:Uncharacterized protein n=1 Tax=Hungatella hominis TaxID=2763050 RepID=A0ABR7HH34_9FIRM|nr:MULTISPECIES: hypothetical protein [Hungatella]MBC5712494.1 hypothetical protein [Hungatella hominis]
MDEKGKNFRNQILNEADMLEGCRNRMCITDDEQELERLYCGLGLRAANLYHMNLRRIREMESNGEDN